MAPILLPTIEAVRPPSKPPSMPVGRRLGIATLALSALVPAQAALAGGVALLTGGTAASVYLAAKPAPGAPALKQAMPMRPSPASSGTSPQLLARSLVTGSPAAFVWEGVASPERTPAPRHASQGAFAQRLQIAVARDPAVAQLPPRRVSGELAVSQRPAQSSTEARAATAIVEPGQEPTSEPKANPTDIQKPKHAQKPTDTKNPPDSKKPPESKPPESKPPDSKPPDSKKPGGKKPTEAKEAKGTQKSKDKPKDTSKPKPPATKPPTAETPSPPDRQPTPASAPESQPPTTTPSTTSDPTTHGPPDGQAGPPDQNGGHGEDKGKKGDNGNGKGRGH